MNDAGFTRARRLGMLAVPAVSLLLSLAAHAQEVRGLTDQKPVRAGYGTGALDGSGSFAYISSNVNLAGGDPLLRNQIIEFDLITGQATQISNFADGVGAVAVSDDGAWLAFLSTSDPLGTNADQSTELFVMMPDGTGLDQLTSNTLTGFISELSISDDGQRIAYAHDDDPFGTNPEGNQEIFAINADGTGHRQLTSAVEGRSSHPSLSGNGAKIAFTSSADLAGPNFSPSWRIFIINWDGSGLQQLTGPFSDPDVSTSPSITDDATTIVYESDDDTGANPDRNFEIWKMNADGSGKTQLTDTTASTEIDSPSVSGGGGRIVFYTWGPFPGDFNTDGGWAVMAMNSGGIDVQLLVELEGHGDWESDISADGSRIAFLSTKPDPIMNPDRLMQAFRVQVDGSELTQVTQLTDGSILHLGGITADGNTIVFSSEDNVNRATQIFAIQADGSNLRQLTFGAFSDYPGVASDGSFAVFQSIDNHTGKNADGSAELFRVGLDGSGMLQVAEDDDSLIKRPRIDANGQWVVFQSMTNVLGGNDDGGIEIYRVRTSRPFRLERLTGDPVHSSVFPDISGSGSRIVYSSPADPLGTNPENNDEIFMIEPETGTTTQLTFTTSGGSIHPRISEDGAFVYFKSTAPFFDPLLTGYEPYRVEVATGIVERMGGLRDGGVLSGSFRSDTSVQPDQDGDTAVFVASGDRDGNNADESTEVFVTDLNATATIRVSKDSPTVVSWTVEPRPVRYDVIRGDVASLAIAPDDTVDLGPVLCVENDSVDNDTVGSEDPDIPLPGQAFFYLYRGTQGAGDGPASWDPASGGRERIAGAGSCDP